MDRRPWVVRLRLEVVYLVVTFAVLRWLYAGGTLCQPGTSAAMTGYVFRLSCLVVLFDGLAGGCAWACSLLIKTYVLRFLPIAIATVSMGGVMFGLPDWIWEDHGVLRFLRADCLFAEGYGMMFLFVGPVLFGLLTLVREIAVLKLTRLAANEAVSSSLE